MSALAEAAEDHLLWIASHGYAPSTVTGRRHHLAALVAFLLEWDVSDPAAVTTAHLERYQRQLFHHRKRDGQPLSFRTQAQRLMAVKAFFAWLAAHGTLPYDPASSLVLPRTEHRLPEAVLSAEEIEAVLAAPDTSTPLGVRDRAMVEVLYSSAIRRAELARLLVPDVDVSRGTLFVRQGKGARDRHVPIGVRAASWVAAWRDRVRPGFVIGADPGHLFLGTGGKPLDLDVLSRTVARYVRAAVPHRRGACHLFRHSAATLMLDNGADVRHVAEMLGHAKLETTMIYTRVSLQKLREVHAATHPAEAPSASRTSGVR